MRFTVEKEIFSLFPELIIGAAVLTDIPEAIDPAIFAGRLQAEQQRIRRRFLEKEMEDIPAIAAWRDAYRKFGAKPKKHGSSVESLYRMTLRGIDLKPIHPVVDLYNALSLCHMIPMGADDLDRVEGDIVLTRAAGDEGFQPLRSTEVTHPRPGEIIYRDDTAVLCRRWNWRESDKTKLDGTSRNILVVGEAIPPAGRDTIEAVMEDLRTQAEHHLNTRPRILFLDSRRSSVSLETA